MYYLYLLYSQRTGKSYIGTTSDLKRRLSSHQSGENISTKSGSPWKLVYFEAYPIKEDALRRERNLKRYGQGLRRVKERLTLDYKS